MGIQLALPFFHSRVMEKTTHLGRSSATVGIEKDNSRRQPIETSL